MLNKQATRTIEKQQEQRENGAHLEPPPCPTHRRALALMQLGVFFEVPSFTFCVFLFVFTAVVPAAGHK